MYSNHICVYKTVSKRYNNSYLGLLSSFSLHRYGNYPIYLAIRQGIPLPKITPDIYTCIYFCVIQLHDDVLHPKQSQS